MKLKVLVTVLMTISVHSPVRADCGAAGKEPLPTQAAKEVQAISEKIRAADTVARYSRHSDLAREFERSRLSGPWPDQISGWFSGRCFTGPYGQPTPALLIGTRHHADPSFLNSDDVVELFLAPPGSGAYDQLDAPANAGVRRQFEQLIQKELVEDHLMHAGPTYFDATNEMTVSVDAEGTYLLRYVPLQRATTAFENMLSNTRATMGYSVAAPASPGFCYFFRKVRS